MSSAQCTVSVARPFAHSFFCCLHTVSLLCHFLFPVEHIAGRSRKADRMKVLVAQQFRKHADEEDEEKIHELKRK